MPSSDTAPTGAPVATRVSRRSAVRVVVWATPVIAVVAPAPAYAASCRTLYSGTTNWSDASYSRTSDTASSGGFTASNGVRVGVTFASVFTNYTAQVAGGVNNLGVTNPVGGTGGAGVTLAQTSNAASDAANSSSNQTVTVTFDRAVYNLSFLITDIDSNANAFSDGVAITGASFTSTIPSGSTVSGSGTTASPFRQQAATAQADNATGTTGNIGLTFAGPVTSFKITYWNLVANPSGNRLQAIFIANMTASVYNAGC